jgi:hypothetical protein
MHKGFKYLDISGGRIYSSHDVIFDEKAVPFASLGTNAGALYTSDTLLLPESFSGNNTSPDIDNSPTCFPLPVFGSCVQQQVEGSASASRVTSTNQVPASRSAPALSPTRAGPAVRLVTDVPASSRAGPVPATAPDAPGSPCPGSAPCTTSEAPEEAALPAVPDLQRDGHAPSVAVPSTTATTPIVDTVPLQQQYSAPCSEALQHRTRL